jgi:hypothetical protein|tara:strand:- start:221 stop:1417 length:1197 start_codon:yes stop_codon:yes gene_type:complete
MGFDLGRDLFGDSQEDAQHAAWVAAQEAKLPEKIRKNLFGPAGLGGLMQRTTESRYDPNLFGPARDIVSQSLLQRPTRGITIPDTRYATLPGVQAIPTPAPVAEGFYGSGATGDVLRRIQSGELTVDPQFSPLLGAVEKDVLRQFETQDFGSRDAVTEAIRKAGVANVKVAYDKAVEASFDEQARRNILGGTQGRKELFDRAIGPKAAALASIESDIAQLQFADERAGRELAYDIAINVGKYKSDTATRLAENELSRKMIVAQELRRDELQEKVRLGEMTFEEGKRVEREQRAQDISEMLYNLERSDKTEDRQLAEELRVIEEDKVELDRLTTTATTIYNQALQMDEADLTNYIQTIWNVLNAFTGQASVVSAQIAQLGSQGTDWLGSALEAYKIAST